LLSQSANKDTRQVYGVLGDHLRNIRIKFHQLNANIIWLCTTRQPDEAGKLAMPEIKGRSALTFPAGCKYVWYMRSAATPDGKGSVFNLHTKKYANVMARGRDGGRLPDPIVNPSYTKVRDALQGLTSEDFVDKSEEELIEEAEKAVDENSPLEGPILTLSDPPASMNSSKQATPIKPAAQQPASSTQQPTPTKTIPTPSTSRPATPIRRPAS
jgi:hypothetical protein